MAFFLDDNVYEDTAQALMPRIGAYGAGLIDHLFSSALRFDFSGNTGRVVLASGRLAAPKVANGTGGTVGPVDANKSSEKAAFLVQSLADALDLVWEDKDGGRHKLTWRVEVLEGDAVGAGARAQRRHNQDKGWAPLCSSKGT